MGNNGSIPFTINRIRMRAEYFFTPNLGVEGEWLRDKYGESPAFDQAGAPRELQRATAMGSLFTGVLDTGRIGFGP